MTPDPESIEVVLERIEGIRSDLKEIKIAAAYIDKSLSDFKLLYTGSHGDLVKDVMIASDRLNKHEARIFAIERNIGPLITTAKILSIVGSALVVSVLALLWSLLTGQAHLVIP